MATRTVPDKNEKATDAKKPAHQCDHEHAPRVDQAAEHAHMETLNHLGLDHLGLVRDESHETKSGDPLFVQKHKSPHTNKHII